MLEVFDTLHLGRPAAICAGLLHGEQLAIIDCGPETVFEHTVQSLRSRGLKPEQVTHVLATHIHLDHSGGAWRWAEEYGATVCVHPNGAAHLADPGKLLASATRVFGADMERLWGTIRPVPADRLRIVRDGEAIVVGSTRVEAIETPGHACHHHAYWLETERTLYAGDVAGVSIAGGPCQPPCPPPDIDLGSWKKSLAKVRALQPARIIVTHGGLLKDPVTPLADLERRLDDWAAWVLAQLNAGQAEAQMVPLFEQKVRAELQAAGVTPEILPTYAHGNPADKSVYGLARYWRKFHPERLNASPKPGT